MICKHKFKTANEYLEAHSDSFFIDTFDWDEYRVLEMPDRHIFIDKFDEVSKSGCNFGFRYDIHDNLIYVKGVKKEIDSFMELINEECLGFNYSIVHRQPELVYDHECPECIHLELFGSNVSYETYKNKKPKAMTHEKARSVKVDNHVEEDKFASLIGGEVVPGVHQKQDVLSKNKKLKISLKSGEHKYQIFLYSENHFEKDVSGFCELAAYLKECVFSQPKDKNEYASNEYKYKYKLKIALKKLSDKIKNNLEYFLDISFFATKCNSIAFKFEDYWYVYERYEFLEYLHKNLVVEESEGSSVFPPGGQKIVFKALIGKRKPWVTVGEIEKRYDGNKRALKFWMGAPPFYASPLLELLRKIITEEKILLEKKKISDKEIKAGIILCGKAMDFKEELLIDNI